MDGLLLTAVLPLAAFALLTAGNAFFVAAEFGLVTVDRVAIAQRAEAGDRRARTVRNALRELSFQLTGTQLGITLTALLTGYLAEPALSKLLVPLFKWLIAGLNGTANWLVRRLGIEPQEELASARSPEELGLLAGISARAGALPPETATLMRRTICFGEKRAAKAMTPRVDVVGLRTSASRGRPDRGGARDRAHPLPGVRDHDRPGPRRHRIAQVRVVAPTEPADG